MDSHNVGRNRQSIESALQSITAKTLVIGISTDLLFPPQEQLFLAHNIKNSKVKIIDSFYGHDGFLLETKQLTEIISEFYNEQKTTAEKAVTNKI
jgi:homoserine O-acetyltransferase